MVHIPINSPIPKIMSKISPSILKPNFLSIISDPSRKENEKTINPIKNLKYLFLFIKQTYLNNFINEYVNDHDDY